MDIKVKDTIINQLIYNLNDTYNGQPWYGSSLMEILDKSDVKTINISIVNLYSIASVLKHIVNWRNFTIKMLEKDIEFDIKMNTEADWTKEYLLNEVEWLALVDEFKESQTRIVELLSKKTDEFLKKQVPNRNYDYYFLIEGILQHDIYHFGQIAMIHRFVQANLG